MLREIVLDTETTGLDPDQGHRLVEIAAVELIDHLPSGQSFHRYLNPERGMPEEAFRVRVDDELNPPSLIALGQLTIEVAVRPTIPAEFVVFRVIQDPTGAVLQET